MKKTASPCRKPSRILTGSIAALLAVQSAKGDTTINPGNTFDIDDGNTTIAGNTTTFNDAGPITIFNDGTLQVHPTQNDNIPFSNSLIFTGAAGTIRMKFNDNDTDYKFNGPITSTATGAQTLAIETGFQGNGDRESVTFVQGIPDAGANPLSLNVRFTTQTGSESYVNLQGNNAFTGPITLVKGDNVNSAYLTIGGVFTRNGNDPNSGAQGSGSLGGGSYAATITLDENTILNYFSTTAQTLSGVISGDGALMQSGGGLLTLTGNNTYTGTTRIWGGKTLVIGGGTNATSGVTNDGTLRFDHAGSVAFGAPISGGGSVVKQGAGTATFTGTSSYTGGTTIEAGVLSISQNASLGGGSGALVIKAGTLQAAGSFTLGSGRNVKLGAGAGIEVSPGSTLTYNGTLGDAPAETGSLTKIGAGTLSLGGAGSHTGLTSVSAGVLIATGGTVLGGGGGLSVASNATFAYKPAAAGVMDLGSGGLTLANNSTIGTALSGAASESAITTTGAAWVTGNITLNIFVGNTFTAGLNNLITAASGLNTGGPVYTLQIYNDTNFSVGGLIVSDTAIDVNASSVAPYTDLHWKGGYSGGNNVWALSNGSTGGNWSATSGGAAVGLVAGPTTTVHFSDNGAPNQGAMVLGAPMTVDRLNVTSTATMDLNNDGNTLTLAPASAADGIAISNTAGPLTIAAPVVLGAAQTWTNNSTNPLTVSGTVSGGAALTTSGSGAVALSGTNSHSGGTTIASGKLSVTAGANLGTGAVTINDGATLHVDGASAFTYENATAITLDSGAGTFEVTNTHPTGATFGGGGITGAGGLTKVGAGKMQVSSANTYSGPTRILEGTLALKFSNLPGLYEGQLNGGFNLTDPSPNTSIQLNTRYAQTTDAGFFGGDDKTWVYTGYINNPGATATYTFGESFDDNSYLKIDGVEVINDTDWGNTSYHNHSLTPGRHTFELRVGNYGGGVGPVDGGVNGENLGFAFQRAGAGPWIYQDPGDGSVFTAALPFDGALPSTTAVSIGTDATFDLAGATQQIASLADEPAATGHKVMLAGGQLTIGAPGGETTFTGDILSTVGDGSAVEKVDASVQNLNGAQTYDSLTVTEGTLNVNGELGTTPANGTATVVVADNARLKFGSVSQTLSSLTIGAGATVTFTSGVASGAFSGSGGKLASSGGSAVVPEPGTLGLLVVGALGVLSRRRRDA